MNTFDLKCGSNPHEETQTPNEPNDCFDNFNINFFAHLNNSTVITQQDNNSNNFIPKLRASHKKHNTTKESSSKDINQSMSSHLLLHVDLKQFLIAIQTHKGSLSLQIYLTSFPNTLMNTFLNRISPILVDIMCSHYGNYFFQKLLQKITFTQRTYIFNLIKNQIITISTHQSGTYSIQALIGELKTDNEKEDLLNILSPYYHLLFTNENSYHIMLKLIIDYPENKRISINEFIINNIYMLIQNSFSYTCVSKFISLNTNLNIRSALINALSHNFINLIPYQNGCNIILLVVEKYGSDYINFIYNEMLSNLPYFIQNGNDYIDSIEKILINMYKYKPTQFISMTWKLIKNDYVNTFFLTYPTGIKIISIILQFALPEQKRFFLLKNKQLLQNSFPSYNQLFSCGI